MKGSTFKRCSCRDPETGKQLGSSCPKLAGGRHGRWYFVIEVPPAPGKNRGQIRRGGWDTKRQAQEKLDEARVDALAGRPVDNRETTGEWLTEWLRGKRAIRATTARSYETHVRLYLLPALGHLRLKELRAAHIAAMYRGIEDGNAGRERPV